VRGFGKAVNGFALFGVLLAAGLTASACSSNSSGSGGSSATQKAAFCADNVKLDQASANTSTPQQALQVLKTNESTLDDLANHLPSGKVGQEAQALVTAFKNAISKNDTSVFNSQTLGQDGADVDTYCGVDGSGNPLPSYFAQGKGSALCNANATLSNGVGSAASAADAVSFLEAHQSDISTFSAGIPSLPSSLQGEAQTLVSTAQSAISQNDGSLLQSQTVSNDSNDIDLYCGVNH
jgi:hypothetical protein